MYQMNKNKFSFDSILVRLDIETKLKKTLKKLTTASFDSILVRLDIETYGGASIIS